MQMRAFRGSRTVMSLRLCSLAPWTISSSAAIENGIVSTEHVFVQCLRFRPLAGGNGAAMAETARRTAVVTLVVGGIVVLAVVLWKVKLLLAILFLGFILAAAIRPGIDAMRRRGIPRGVGLAIHYLALAGLLALALWLVVPRALDQVDNAIGNIPETRQELGKSARQSEGIKADVLRGLQARLREVRGEELIEPA